MEIQHQVNVYDVQKVQNLSIAEVAWLVSEFMLNSESDHFVDSQCHPLGWHGGETTVYIDSIELSISAEGEDRITIRVIQEFEDGTSQEIVRIFDQDYPGSEFILDEDESSSL